MLDNYLPSDIANALNNIPYNSLCELRLRKDNYVIINILGANYYLTNSCFSEDSTYALKISNGAINSILQKISNNSMYTINDDLINGFVTISGGIRLGVCGEVVTIDNKVTTIKNISSINFRFPHFIKNCSLNIYPYIVNNGKVKSTLIISPPGGGKTTYLRDLIYQLQNRENLLNILVVDERDEIVNVFNGFNCEKITSVDVYSKCSKRFGFDNGIRSMAPNLIITDEININNDLEIIELALTAGVKVIATIHASSINDLKNKLAFKDILRKQLFDRYVVLSSENGLGTLEGIYNENLEFIGV